MDTLPDTLLVPKGYTFFDILHGVQTQPLVNTLPDTVAKAHSGSPPCGRYVISPYARLEANAEVLGNTLVDVKGDTQVEIMSYTLAKGKTKTLVNTWAMSSPKH